MNTAEWCILTNGNMTGMSLLSYHVQVHYSLSCILPFKLSTRSGKSSFSFVPISKSFITQIEKNVNYVLLKLVHLGDGPKNPRAEEGGQGSYLAQCFDFCPFY